ncbi:hypothetical protein [Mycetocola sp. 2940]|uniref:hypothetical protein n=1 Tax=Mycetocola sp. 2940 TaxID=3156452 RepID=UPI003399AC0D
MKTATRTIQLDARLNGPLGSANGGFASGMIAETLGGTASVRLIRRIPLERPLEVGMDADAGFATVTDFNHQLVAKVQRVDPFTMIPPVQPSFADAEVARASSPLQGARHLLSKCVVCGSERRDGLAVTPGPLENRSDVLAAPFVPVDRDTTDGVVHPGAVWGALDCPSYPAQALLDRRLGLLGTLTAHRNRDVLLGERLVAVGWTVQRHGRSTQTASALLDGRGDVVASARAVWVELRHQWLVRLVGRLA